MTEANPFPYVQTPRNLREAQSNCNHWAWIALGGCPEGEVLANWRTYIREFTRHANRVRDSFLATTNCQEAPTPMPVAISPVEAANLRAPVTRPFTPSQTDLTDMIARAMAACDASRDAAHKAALEDRFEAASAANRRRARDRHDAYCNQMPRARGFRT